MVYVSVASGQATPSNPVQEQPPATGLSAIRPEIKDAIDSGLRYLRSRQTAEGRWQVMGHDDPGITALAVTAFLKSPRKYSAEDGPFIRLPLEYLASLAKEDGGIYDRGLANYVTCVSVLAMEASGDTKYRPLIERAKDFLLRLQCDEGEGYRPADKFYGGAGYGGDERPDLSNMNFWIDGLRVAGVSKEDEAVRKAMRFLNRCQNHSETNTEVFRDPHDGKEYVAGNDGGAAYYPGFSNAGYDATPDGKWVPRSYGSMTYALLRCYLFAGLAKDDPRLAAACRWIRDNYTFDENPGFDTSKDAAAGAQGLYYYYYTAAMALRELGVDEIEDRDGVTHSWRVDLASKLLTLQREDGSWANENPRWWEGEPLIATTYAVLALSICHDKQG